jgi:hypothetical protein
VNNGVVCNKRPLVIASRRLRKRKRERVRIGRVHGEALPFFQSVQLQEPPGNDRLRGWNGLRWLLELLTSCHIFLPFATAAALRSSSLHG